MAGAFTQQNAATLTERIGRTPTEGELYVAHFLGAAGGAQLINAASQDPNATAASVFPGAAKSNPSIFYDKQGHPRSLSGVYHVLVARYDVARASPNGVAASAIAAAAPADQPAATTAQAAAAPVAALQATTSPAQPATRPTFHSLFSDNGQREPVSQVVRDLWSSNPRVAAALSGQSDAATAAVQPASAGGQMNLFSDQPSDVRALFGAGS
jgi:hypothetical protein